MARIDKITAVMYERKFRLEHVVNNFSKRMGWTTNTVRHFSIPWMIIVVPGKEVQVSLGCGKEKSILFPWAVEVRYTLCLLSNQSKWVTKEPKSVEVTTKTYCASSHLLAIEEIVQNFLIDNTLTVALEVVITNMTGFAFKRMLKFDKPGENQTDVILEVGGKPFHVSKVFLATHSPYFETLFFAQFAESKKEKIELKDVDADDFQNLLEIIHGKTNLTTQNVSSVLQLCDMFDVKMARVVCETFVIQSDDIGSWEKFRLATAFKLDTLVDNCINSTKTLKELRSIMPENVDDVDNAILAKIAKKCLSSF